MVNLVMEYMDGGSLEDLVQAGGCQDEAVLADIARQTLNGLNYLHSHKSIHRDIKPANILCSSSGLIKISDFGISIILDNTAIMAQSFVGTVCYMSPERIVGERYSFPSDIWSFGLTLLAVACGKFPITDISANDGYWGMIKAICDENPPIPSEEFSNNFSDFISICLIKDHQTRAKIDELNKHDFSSIGMDETPLSPLRSKM
jgi:serine/threonine protein kinase